MSDGLKYVPIADLASINPPTPTTYLRPDEMVSFIPMSDVTETGRWNGQQVRKLHEVRHGYTPFQEGDVLFAKITPCMENGKGAHAIGLVNGIGFGTTEFHVLRAKPPNIAGFIYHWLQSEELRRNAEARMTGSAGQQRVPAIFFEEYKVFLPSPVEQCCIAQILDALDTQIQETERLIAKLKQVKAGLLYDLLTKGIDENGEVRDPVAHPEQFKEVVLQERIHIPKEWEIRTLDYFLTGIDAGKSPNCPDRPAGADEWGILKVSAIHSESFREWENKVITNPVYISPAYEVQDGDLLISRANTYELVGMVCLVRKPRPQLLLCDKTLRLRIDNKHALTEFIFYLLQMPFVRSQIEIHATGSSGSMKNISQDTIKNLLVYVPPLKKEEQERIVAVLDAHDARISAEESRLSKLQQIKKGLMHDLLTGTVRVTSLVSSSEQ